MEILQNLCAYFLVGMFILMIFKNKFDKGVEKNVEGDDDFMGVNIETIKTISYVLFIIFWCPIFINHFFKMATRVNKNNEDET